MSESNPYREDREPCRECAERASKKESAPMKTWHVNLIFVALCIIATWALLGAAFFVGQWHEDGRNFATVVGLIVGLAGLGVALAIAIDRTP
jgi:hypothetical protein